MAEEHAPSIVFIDEIDAIGTKRYAFKLQIIFLSLTFIFISFESVKVSVCLVIKWQIQIISSFFFVIVLALFEICSKCS